MMDLLFTLAFVLMVFVVFVIDMTRPRSHIMPKPTTPRPKPVPSPRGRRYR